MTRRGLTTCPKKGRGVEEMTTATKTKGGKEVSEMVRTYSAVGGTVDARPGGNRASRFGHDYVQHSRAIGKRAGKAESKKSKNTFPRGTALGKVEAKRSRCSS